MRTLLVFVTLFSTYVQFASAKTPDRCADLLRAHVAAAPRFNKWRHTYDAITGRGEVELVLKVKTATNTRDPRTLSLPPWRTMRVLEPFTFRDGEDTYYVVKGEARDFELYGADLTRDFGAPSPGLQVIGAERPIAPPRLMNEILARVPYLDAYADRANEWLETKSPTYARYTAWFGQRTARLARWLNARRIPDVTPTPALRERIDACATPFCVFEPIAPDDFREAFTFLRERNPGFDLAVPGHLPRMFVNVLDQLAVATHDENTALITATGVSEADVTNIATAEAQARVFAAFEVVRSALVTGEHWPYRDPISHDVAFLDHLISAYQDVAMGRHRTTVPWRLTLDEWRDQNFETVYFDKFHWRFVSSTPVTLVTDAESGRAWAVVTKFFSERGQMVDYLEGVVGVVVSSAVRQDLARFDAIPRIEPRQFVRAHGVPIFDRASAQGAVARVARPTEDGVGHYGDIVIVPLDATKSPAL